MSNPSTATSPPSTGRSAPSPATALADYVEGATLGEARASLTAWVQRRHGYGGPECGRRRRGRAAG